MSGELEREIALLERSLASGIEQMQRMTARMVVMQATLARIRKAAADRAGGTDRTDGGRAGGTPPAIAADDHARMGALYHFDETARIVRGTPALVRSFRRRRR